MRLKHFVACSAALVLAAAPLATRAQDAGQPAPAETTAGPVEEEGGSSIGAAIYAATLFLLLAGIAFALDGNDDEDDNRVSP